MINTKVRHPVSERSSTPYYRNWNENASSNLAGVATFGKIMTINTHHTKFYGDVAVSAVLYDLTKRGYYVFMPLWEHVPYALIVDTGEVCYRIQIKRRADGQIPKHTSWSDKNGPHIKQIQKTDFDFFAIVSADDKIAYCPSEMMGKKISFYIPNSYCEFNYWEDFRDFRLEIPNKRKNTSVRRSTSRRPQRHKIVWPSNDEMRRLVWNHPLGEIGSRLGVSDVAVKKYCDRFEIDRPPFAYWRKRKVDVA